MSLLHHWRRATKAQRRSGRKWYAEARRQARLLGQLHGVTTATAAGVLAALSPRLHWTSNVRAAHRLLHGEDVHGVFMANLRIGQRIFAGERPLSALSGPKVRAFYRAIMGDPSAAVVDVWIARAAGIKGAPTSKQYAAVARALVRGAAAARVSVPTFQATVWVAVRGRA